MGQWGSRSIESDPIDSCPPPVWVIARRRHQQAGRQRLRIFAKVGSFGLGCDNARTDPGAVRECFFFVVLVERYNGRPDPSDARF